MSKFQINLNGSNITSKERDQAFQDALNDGHFVECSDGQPATAQLPNSTSPEVKIMESGREPVQKYLPGKPAGSSVHSRTDPNVDQALDLSFKHQNRTMEIHQQYLTQQGDYFKLITAVLDQQKHALEQNPGTAVASTLEPFQQNLNNIHNIREQGLKVHQEFLTQQAAFSERYITVLEKQVLMENNGKTSFAAHPEQNQEVQWVLAEENIVIADEKVKEEKTSIKTNEEIEIAQSARSANHESQRITADLLAKTLLEIVGEKTGYPTEMLELEMDLEADLGIDSIKRVEILGALEDRFPSLPPADTDVLAQTRTLQEIVSYMAKEAGDQKQEAIPSVDISLVDPPEPVEHQDQPVPEHAPTTEQSHSASELTEVLLGIVAEKTGYPAEMLETNMDMEADLGIDSIKRVEILGAMEERVPGLPTVDADLLAELRTLGQIIDFMSHEPAPDKASTSPEQEVKKKVNSLNLENSPVGLMVLPKPDKLYIEIPDDKPLIVTDEGTDFTTKLVSALIEEGWKVLLWSFPDSLVTRQDRHFLDQPELIHQELTGKESINSILAKTLSKPESISGFIHLHPRSDEDNLFNDGESAVIKQVFLLTGALKNYLIKSENNIRSLFMTVTRTDGQLGISKLEHFQQGSGLPGLVKTVNWEWPDTFCRAVDLQQNNSEQDQVNA
ncbi:MAG: phosphopantetheine-binding protein, partial [Anaerolineales bacterium]|nr:phosphopantetheine-binding protein [Anaerolineales bacterium]